MQTDDDAMMEFLWFNDSTCRKTKTPRPGNLKTTEFARLVDTRSVNFYAGSSKLFGI
jgi:hypothetical protein